MAWAALTPETARACRRGVFRARQRTGWRSEHVVHEGSAARQSKRGVAGTPSSLESRLSTASFAATQDCRCPHPHLEGVPVHAGNALAACARLHVHAEHRTVGASLDQTRQIGCRRARVVDFTTHLANDGRSKGVTQERVKHQTTSTSYGPPLFVTHLPGSPEDLGESRGTGPFRSPAAKSARP